MIIDWQRYLDEEHHLTISINKVICQLRDPIKLIIKPGLHENGINEPHPPPRGFLPSTKYLEELIVSLPDELIDMDFALWVKACLAKDHLFYSNNLYSVF